LYEGGGQRWARSQKQSTYNTRRKIGGTERAVLRTTIEVLLHQLRMWFFVHKKKTVAVQKDGQSYTVLQARMENLGTRKGERIGIEFKTQAS